MYKLTICIFHQLKSDKILRTHPFFIFTIKPRNVIFNESPNYQYELTLFLQYWPSSSCQTGEMAFDIREKVPTERTNAPQNIYCHCHHQQQIEIRKSNSYEELILMENE